MADIDTSFLDSSWTLSSEEFDSKQKKRQLRTQALSRQSLERKELLHAIDLLKLEVAQKNLRIENLQVENASRTEDLQERLSDANHQCQMLQARMQHVTKTSESEVGELRRRLSSLVVSLRDSEEKCQLAQENLAQLNESCTVPSVHLYNQLKHRSADRLSAKELLQVMRFACCQFDLSVPCRSSVPKGLDS